jgi:hypothetical protein
LFVDRITDSYHQMFIDVPVMRDIWQAAQADRSLQKTDAAEESLHAGDLGKRSRSTARTPPHKPGSDSPSAGASMR